MEHLEHLENLENLEGEVKVLRDYSCLVPVAVPPQINNLSRDELHSHWRLE